MKLIKNDAKLQIELTSIGCILEAYQIIDSHDLQDNWINQDKILRVRLFLLHEKKQLNLLQSHLNGFEKAFEDGVGNDFELIFKGKKNIMAAKFVLMAHSRSLRL